MKTISFSITSPQSTNVEHFTLPADSPIWIYPIRTYVSCNERDGKWVVRSLIPYHCIDAFKEKRIFTSSYLAFETEEEALEEKLRLQQECRDSLTHIQKQGGIRVTLQWLQKQDFSWLDKFIRISQHPHRTDQYSLEESIRQLLLHPTFLGMWLGDGTSDNPDITSADAEIVKWVFGYAHSLGLKYVRKTIHNPYAYHIPRSCHCTTIGRTRAQAIKFTKFAKWRNSHQSTDPYEGMDSRTRSNWENEYQNMDPKARQVYNTIFYGLKDLNLLKNKHIPEVYKKSSRAVRLALLAGTLDTDGSKTSDSYEIAQKNEILAHDIMDLAKSLGFFVFSTKKLAIATNAKDHQDTWVDRMRIYGLGLQELPLLLTRKQMNNAFKSRCYLARIHFGQIKNCKKRKRKIEWNQDEEDALKFLFSTHGPRWVKIRKDLKFKEYAEKKDITPGNIRDHCIKMKLCT